MKLFGWLKSPDPPEVRFSYLSRLVELEEGDNAWEELPVGLKRARAVGLNL